MSANVPEPGFQTGSTVVTDDAMRAAFAIWHAEVRPYRPRRTPTVPARQAPVAPDEVPVAA